MVWAKPVVSFALIYDISKGGMKVGQQGIQLIQVGQQGILLLSEHGESTTTFFCLISVGTLLFEYYP